MRSCLLLICLTSAVHADELPPSVDRVPVRMLGQTPEQMQQRREYRSRLQKTIEIDFEKRPLREAIDSIFRHCGVPVRWDLTALEEEGIPANEPLTLRLNPMPAESASAVICRQLHLGYRVEAKEVLMSTGIALLDFTWYGEIWVYDLTAILEASNPLRLTEAEKADILARRIWMGPREEWFPDDVKNAFLYELATVIKEYIFPLWREDDPEFLVEVLGQSLVVRSTQAELLEVDALLESLAELLSSSKRTVPFATASVGQSQMRVIREELENRNVRLQVNAELTEKVLRRLLNDAKIPWAVDWQALEEEGFGKNHLERSITLEADSISLASALDLILRPLDLTATATDGLLMITTQIRGEGIRGLNNFTLIRIDSLPLDVAKKVPDLIRRTVGDHSEWAESGGEHFVDPLTDRLLTVRTTSANLKQILELIEYLEVLNPNTKAAPATTPQTNPDAVVLRYYRFYCEEAARRQHKNLPVIVQPATWKRETVGIVRDAETLIIRQTPAVHAALRAYLEHFEQQGGNRCHGDPTIDAELRREKLIPPPTLEPGLRGGGGNFFSLPNDCGCES